VDSKNYGFNFEDISDLGSNCANFVVPSSFPNLGSNSQSLMKSLAALTDCERLNFVFDDNFSLCRSSNSGYGSASSVFRVIFLGFFHKLL
jgi:hypothetical protein